MPAFAVHVHGARDEFLTRSSIACNQPKWSDGSRWHYYFQGESKMPSLGGYGRPSVNASPVLRSPRCHRNHNGGAVIPGEEIESIPQQPPVPFQAFHVVADGFDAGGQRDCQDHPGRAP